jgi:hypothetical protein
MKVIMMKLADALIKKFLIKESRENRSVNNIPLSNAITKASSKKLHSKQLLEVWSDSCPIDQ